MLNCRDLWSKRLYRKMEMLVGTTPIAYNKYFDAKTDL